MRILIISEYIAPVQAVASIRWTKIAKYIKKSHSDVSITVLTNEKNYNDKASLIPIIQKDSLLECDMIAFDNFWIIPMDEKLEWYYRLKKRKYGTTQAIVQEDFAVDGATMKHKLQQDIREFLNDYKNQMIANAAWRFFKKKREKFDVIISSYGPIWTHLVAEKIKKQNPQTTWVADFRDPYAKDTDAPLAFRRHDRFVRTHCAVADVLTRVADTLYLNEPTEAHTETISNGYDPAERLPSIAPRSFDMVFTGTLYGMKTNLCVFFQVLKEMKAEGVADEQTAHVIYAGGQGVDALSMAKEQNAESFLIDKGMIPRCEALELQQRAAILIQLGWNEEHAQSMWTGKTYEYMSMGKPIAYAITGNIPFSLPTRNIHRLGGVCYEQCRHEETYPALKQYILNKYQEWKQTGNVTIQRDEEYVAQYSYQKIAEQVWNLLQSRKSENNERKAAEKNRR